MATRTGWRAQLWPHQVRAIDLIRGYFAAAPERGSALVRMPTGTGKSGVIAVTAHELVQGGHTLVLAPWDALVDQLGRDISVRFWARIRTRPPSRRPVVRLLPSTVDQELRRARGSTIFVATIAALEDLHRDPEKRLYKRLARSLGAVLVDEGHYEPAPNWSRAVRELERPIVLFTATPYRNDFHFFSVHKDYFYSFSHEEAEAQHFVRRVEFASGSWSSPESFVRELLEFLARTFKSEQPRVIVRCATQQAVQQVTAALASQKAAALGIHERFGRGDPRLRRDVPDADLPDLAQFWVHQYKLIEGIDSPAFRVLAMYEPMRNERSFVQQVGRVLRNPERSPRARAWVFSRAEEKLASSWDSYRIYDRDPRNNSYESLATAADFVRSQPLRYHAGRFRALFDLHSQTVHEEINYPRSTQAYPIDRSFDLNTLTSDIERQWHELDRELGEVREPDRYTRVHPYIALRNSPLLLRTAFTESEVGITVYRRVRGYLFYYDSQGQTPDALADVPRVAPGSLERLYRGAVARLTSVSLRNTQLGRYDVRRRSLQAYAVDELAPDLADHAHFASTATGFTQPRQDQIVQRYVGFTNARVSDRSGGTTTYEEYVAWLEALADQLDASPRPLAVFNRYAEVVPPPNNPSPENVLLDFDAALFEESLLVAAGKPRALDIADLCLDVEPDGTFQLDANGRHYSVAITWSAQTQTYHLQSQELDDAYTNRDIERRPRSLIAYLNRLQAFRVVPRHARYLIYSRRRFYRPRVPLWGEAAAGRLELLNILEPVEQFAQGMKEKGGPKSTINNGAGWAAGSLFQRVDSLGAGTSLNRFMKTLDLLVCDDMGTEVADFIGVDSKQRRVIAMHAKAFDPPRLQSASALHEVSAQALKNLGFFQPFAVGEPANLDRWDKPWVNNPVGTVTTRIRRGNCTGQEAWQRVRDALRDPNYAREIWLLLAGGLSKRALEANRALTKPPPETIQILYALQAVWSSVSATGARLRIFCAP